MGLQDNPIRVQLGFRTRPLRDGGGKPSWQTTPPPQLPKSQCPSLAKDLAALCAPWMQGFTDSIQQGNKAHPFPVHIALEDPRAAFPGVPERERPHGNCGRAALLFEPDFEPGATSWGPRLGISTHTA